MVQYEISVEQLGSLTVYDECEEAIQLSTLWQKGTAVLVFVRHFGWVICRQQVAELTECNNDFSQRGAQLIVVGNGKVKDLKKFRDVTGYRGILLTDPTRDAYKILKFKSGISDIIGVKSFTQSFSALRSGFIPGSLQGHALQLGGAVVVVPEGNITYLFRSSAAGDHPPLETLLAAVG